MYSYILFAAALAGSTLTSAIYIYNYHNGIWARMKLIWELCCPESAPGRKTLGMVRLAKFKLTSHDIVAPSNTKYDYFRMFAS